MSSIEDANAYIAALPVHNAGDATPCLGGPSEDIIVPGFADYNFADASKDIKLASDLVCGVCVSC